VEGKSKQTKIELLIFFQAVPSMHREDGHQSLEEDISRDSRTAKWRGRTMMLSKTSVFEVEVEKQVWRDADQAPFCGSLQKARDL
jgi:hypothetical protein